MKPEVSHGRYIIALHYSKNTPLVEIIKPEMTTKRRNCAAVKQLESAVLLARDNSITALINDTVPHKLHSMSLTRLENQRCSAANNKTEDRKRSLRNRPAYTQSNSLGQSVSLAGIL